LRPVELHPFVIVGEPLFQAAMMGLPLADPEIEIVQTGQVGGLRGLRVVLAGVRDSHGPQDGGEEGSGERGVKSSHGTDARPVAAVRQ